MDHISVSILNIYCRSLIYVSIECILNWHKLISDFYRVQEAQQQTSGDYILICLDHVRFDYNSFIYIICV